MKVSPWILVGVVLVLIGLVLATRNVREHLTGQAVIGQPDIASFMNGVITPAYGSVIEWLETNNPTATQTENIITVAYLAAYAPKYSAASAPLSPTDFGTDFVGVFNAGSSTFGLPPAQPSQTADQMAQNPWALVVYNYYYGPKSKTPYVAPTSTVPTPTPAPHSSTTSTPAPPASSSSPNQPLTFYVPQPCKTEYKNIPGGAVEVKCFD